MADEKATMEAEAAFATAYPITAKMCDLDSPPTLFNADEMQAAFIDGYAAGQQSQASRDGKRSAWAHGWSAGFLDGKHRDKEQESWAPNPYDVTERDSPPPPAPQQEGE